MPFSRWNEFFAKIFYRSAFAVSMCLVGALLGISTAGFLFALLLFFLDISFGVPKYLLNLSWIPTLLIGAGIMMVVGYAGQFLFGLSFISVDAVRWWQWMLLVVGGFTGEVLLSKVLVWRGINIPRS
ncbi:MAG: hypothetical protein A3I44_02550 [Candidatus Sungbacteria bacterium RIFCSPLOWO2_02_FULL_51_17]|uniref:Uncharacterized protein n=1 Tax=Candidatus Sungbacteria bacterium RIFCSPHIGHO2_02_FULL_51_29 TaxID=1802273 RepID=A0A1G2KSP9_9BACT|nr:MAG: hypothetical protein A2676_00250 [Candidatus Sungbacteria bacterium RIFCSPHIGHO2_01_FULL_51_22]OHA02475.1 MAG: hypothetical protein A3C16_05360 [Candidatus Sungbacteria bacterium RIFCSPHIGHO2_02_FULL_51_29]OHA06751.1 MAG: hypothetical protein A3B29_00965 [Candidatus Sungbacteria bacterium RIFCSPLOWO2_01_FULL_51_34]OHA11947.1 MAG: hypothetical protein A3I44_02550 [Candidatus Sungbacteria bacterium RIFCSPLOWO2_02_FULL_51_17]